MTEAIVDAVGQIVVEGDLDRVSAPELLIAARQLFETVETIQIDVTAATVIDSASLGVLVELHTSACSTGVRLEIVIGPRYQQTLFQVAGLTPYLNMVQSLSSVGD